MFEETWNLIKEWFNKLFRFFAYGETGLDKQGIYVVMFLVIGVLFVLSLSLKRGKGRPINSPILFIVAIALTIFTVNL